MGYQIVAQFLSSLLWALTSHLNERKYHKGQAALKFATRFLQLNHLFGDILSVKCFDGSLGCRHDLLFYIHILKINCERATQHE